MKTLSNVQRSSPEEGKRLARTLSCPSSLGMGFSDSTNSIISISNSNSSRPQTQTTGRPSLSNPKEKPSKEAMSKTILPAKRPCCEQSVEKESDSSTRPLKTKRLASRIDERAADPPDTTDTADAPPPVPSLQIPTSAGPVGFGRTAMASNASKRTQKRLSRSSTIDNSDIQMVRPMKVVKQQSAAIETWRLNTIKSRQRHIEQTKQAGLLSSFVQYEDQLEGPVSRLSLTNASPLTRHDDGVPLCVMDSETTKKQRRRSTQTQSTKMTTIATSSSKSHPSSTDSNFPKLSIVLRTFFVICSLLSFTSRCLVWFGGRMSILYSMVENPMVWTLRLHISLFHMALLIVECNWGIPIILPQGETLSILTQRGFLQSFLGIIDLLMHASNKRMTEHIDIIQDVEGDLMSARERRVQIAYAIISVSSRGMIVIGCIYALLGLLYDGYNGKKKQHGGIDR
ncbi:hypothetical protein ACHAWT_008047 [Skeletonema menzelii]